MLFDPLAPQAGEDADSFWRALDRDVERHGPPNVLLTIHWHTRSADRILDRYEGARVWAYEPDAEEVRRRTRVTDTFAAGDPLPGGVEPHGVGPEAVFWVPEHRALVVDDTLIAAPGKPLRVWSGGDVTRRLMRPLLDLPIDMVLLTHGPPVVDGGREALAAALEA